MLIGRITPHPTRQTEESCFLSFQPFLGPFHESRQEKPLSTFTSNRVIEYHSISFTSPKRCGGSNEKKTSEADGLFVLGPKSCGETVDAVPVYCRQQLQLTQGSSFPLFIIMADDTTRSAEMAVVTQRIFGDTGIHVRYTPCTSWCTAFFLLHSSESDQWLRYPAKSPGCMALEACSTRFVTS